MHPAPLRILRLPEVMQRVGLGKSQIYELESQGKFPKRIKISDRASGHLEHEVEAYLAGRVALSRGVAIDAGATGSDCEQSPVGDQATARRRVRVQHGAA